ncbi:MAG: hypothetical protein AUG96_01500 [Chloroflexi bacterium 13_1_20CM_4_66_15]|nr:MAG: hypothetical protein AUG96_01500 [Chloroflexi bacterium 13_1_20CM_4_66_15]
MVIAGLAAAGYTTYAGNRVYQSLESGRRQLVAAQASMKAAAHSADPRLLAAAAAQLQYAERDFDDANRRSRDDPALRLVGGVPAAGRQIDASAHLAAIGADMSRAGEGAAAVAIQVAALKQKYAGRPLGADDLEAALEEAQTIARNYSASTRAIGEQLHAAHAERERVTTTDLIGPLRDAYDQVDRALVEADTAFLRYQDVRQVLADFLGVRLPA